jgi:hypothetical protein
MSSTGSAELVVQTNFAKVGAIADEQKQSGSLQRVEAVSI